jgi:hypothetical protein
MFSRWIVTNITSARGTLHCRKTRIPCGDQLVICGLYNNTQNSILLYCRPTGLRNSTAPGHVQFADMAYGDTMTWLLPDHRKHVSP